MDYNNQPSCVNEETHVSMAKEIAYKLINEFSSQQQKEFINIVGNEISDNYNRRIEELEKDINTVKSNFDNFIGNIPVNNNPN